MGASITQIERRGRAQGSPTVAPYEQNGYVGHSGVPVFFHWGLSAAAGIAGSVGFSQGNPRALIVPPDRYRGLSPLDASNTAMGRKQAASRPTRGKAPAKPRGQ